MIIHLNGMPGVGKFTVAKELRKALNGFLIDNHVSIDVALAVSDRGSPDYFEMIDKVMDIILERINAAPTESYIFTNCLSAEHQEDRDRFEKISNFAEIRKISFVQVLLECDLEENKRRIATDDRKSKGKLLDPDELIPLREKYTIYDPPGKHSLKIDTTFQKPLDVSAIIEKYLKDNGIK